MFKHLFPIAAMMFLTVSARADDMPANARPENPLANVTHRVDNIVDADNAKPQEPVMQQQIPQPPPLPQQPPALQARMQQGRYFQFAVPLGWQVKETDSGVDLMAPDGATVVSHAMTRGPGQMDPDRALGMVLQYAAQNGVSNVRMISRQPFQGNANGVVYVLSFDYWGTPVHSVNFYTVVNGWGDYKLDVMAMQGPALTLGRDLPVLTQLSQSVVVTNPNEVCGNDRLIRFTPPVSVHGAGSSNPVGEMIIAGEQNRNRIRDNIHEHNADVTRGVTRWGENGNIVAPNNAERVFETPGGKAIYDVRTNTPRPPNGTEVDPYKYDR